MANLLHANSCGYLEAVVPVLLEVPNGEHSQGNRPNLSGRPNRMASYA